MYSVLTIAFLSWWLGLLICVFFETGFFLVLIFKLNWKKVTHKAQLRAGKKVVVIPKRPLGTVLSEAMMPDISDCPSVQLDGEEAPKADGYSPVNTQDQEQKVGREAGGNNTNAGVTERDVEQSKNTKPEALLPVTQLILRRGLIALVSVLILAIGVIFHIAFPAPEPSAQSKANFTLNWANDSTPTPLAPLDLTPNH